VLLTAAVALRQKEDVYPILLEGGAEGLRLLASIVPALVLLLKQ